MVELGNKKFPYKSLNMAFVEIVNTYSNRPESDIKILIKENTLNFVKQGSLRIVKMGKITIESYSDSSVYP